MILTFFLGFSLIFISEYLKRREGDSNPDTLLGYTRFPGVPLQPLEHLSFFRSAKIEQIFKTSKYLSPQSI